MTEDDSTARGVKRRSSPIDQHLGKKSKDGTQEVPGLKLLVQSVQ